MALLVAYDLDSVTRIVRDWTGDRLLHDLDRGRVCESLHPHERRALRDLLIDWHRRALGKVMLRDAMLVDRQRGQQIYTLLCRSFTHSSHPVPAAAAPLFAAGAAPPDLPALRVALDELGTRPAIATEQAMALALLDGVLLQAERHALALYCSPTTANEPVQFPLPAHLESLLPTLPPAPQPRLGALFVPPSGWRRTLAITLAAVGILWLAVPLLLGQVPIRPAGAPLGLLTLALLVGIRAGWAGYAGSLYLWLVPNLPWFHYGQRFDWLLTLPLLVAGTVLIAMDKHIRALWWWIWRR